MSAKYFPKKFFTLLLFIVFMSGLIPSAQADSYNLWVGNVEVTSDNYSDSNSKWSYNATNNTLTLNGFTYTGAGHENTGIYYNGNNELKIVINGTNTITMDNVNNNSSSGIYSEKGLNFSGTGSLSVTGGEATANNANSYGIYSKGNITVNSGTIKAKSKKASGYNSFGINCGGTITVEGGTVEAEGDEGQNSNHGISGKMIVKGGTVTAKGGKTNGNTSAIYCANGMIVEGGIVTATGGTGPYAAAICTTTLTVSGGIINATGGTTNTTNGASYGIACMSSTITVSGGQVTAKGGNATNGESCGIYCKDATMTVTGGTIKATGGSANNPSRGIYCKNMTIESGTINATGGSSSNDDSHGIDCRNGTMTVNGGTVTATGGQGKEKSYGIECSSNMEFKGGIITATGGTTTDTDGASYGIDCDADIRVKGATVTGTGGNAGIHCSSSNGTITVTNGEVTATGTKNESYGIQCAEQLLASVRLSSTNDSLTITGGKLTAIGNKKAISIGDSGSFTNQIAGTGWTDTTGTAGKAAIPINAGKDAILSYKKIVFPAQQSSAPSNPGGDSGGGQSTTGYEVIDTDTKNNTQTTTTDVTVRGNLSGTNIVEVIQQIESTTEVKTLDLSNVTGVTEVKLPENTKIETLTITENTSIKKVEVSNNDSLKTINLSGSKIEEINASECSGLETVEVENNTSLVTLNVSYSSVTILNAKNCVNLETLNCERCEIRDLNIEGCQKLWGLDCSYNNLTRLDVSAFSNLSSLACQGQIVRGFKRVQSFNLIDFLFRKTSEFFLADYTEEELKELDYVHNLKAFDESGNEIQVNSDEQGNLTFSKIPAKITYDYDTGFNNIVMDVTVETAEDESGEEDGSGKVSGSGGSGGGCNSNFGFAALAVLLKFCSRNSLRKSRKRT